MLLLTNWLFAVNKILNLIGNVLIPNVVYFQIALLPFLFKSSQMPLLTPFLLLPQMLEFAWTTFKFLAQVSKKNKMGLNFELTFKALWMDRLITTKMYPAKHFWLVFIKPT